MDGIIAMDLTVSPSPYATSPDAHVDDDKFDDEEDSPLSGMSLFSASEPVPILSVTFCLFFPISTGPQWSPILRQSTPFPWFNDDEEEQFLRGNIDELSDADTSPGAQFSDDESSLGRSSPRDIPSPSLPETPDHEESEQEIDIERLVRNPISELFLFTSQYSSDVV